MRYPDFFEIARATESSKENANSTKSDGVVESAMVRHHYGPWDKRYYHVLAYLEAKQLITVTKEGRAFQIVLTNLGKQKAKLLAGKPSYSAIIERMKQIKIAFGGKSGNTLKKLIYEIFDREVGQRPIGEMIKQ